MVFGLDDAAFLQLRANRLIDSAARSIVGGNDDGVGRIVGIVPGNRSDALFRIGNLRDTALLFEERAKLWPKMVEIYQPYADYQTKTAREIPVVVLKRI